jgi:hypothetical protein
MTKAATMPPFVLDPVVGRGSVDSSLADSTAVTGDVVGAAVVADVAEVVGATVVDVVVGATVEEVVVVVVAEVAKPVGLNRSKNASSVPSADLFTTAVSGSKSTVLAKTPTRWTLPAVSSAAL